jgi:hypothetical protein
MHDSVALFVGTLSAIQRQSRHMIGLSVYFGMIVFNGVGMLSCSKAID